MRDGGVMSVYPPKGVKRCLGLASEHAASAAMRSGVLRRAEAPLLTGPDISHERSARRSIGLMATSPERLDDRDQP